MIRAQSRAGDFAAAAFMGRKDHQVIPVEIRDAVEMWARQWGRHGDVGWNHAMQCAVVELTLKPDDPRLRAWQEGRIRHEPKECIPLHYQPRDAQGNAAVHFVGLNIHELGVSGVLEILNRGNTMSGTGEFSDMMAAVRAVGDRNDRLKNEVHMAARENARSRARDMRRQVFDLPLVSVPDNIGARQDG